MQGTRLPDAEMGVPGPGWDAWSGQTNGCGPVTCPPGSYMKVQLGPDLWCWYIRDPVGDIGSLRTHTIEEYPDGTITVSPSIVNANGQHWHGWLASGCLDIGRLMAFDLEVQDRFIEKVREVARECGYAVAVHGSRERDLDLIVVPWVENVIGPRHLVDALLERLPNLRLRTCEPALPTNPTRKPNGRIAWALSGAPACQYLDLSVFV